MKNLNDFIVRELGISPFIKKMVNDKYTKYYIYSSNKLIDEYENNVYNINGLDLYMKLCLISDYSNITKFKNGSYIRQVGVDTSFSLFNKNGYFGVISLEDNFNEINFVVHKFNINQNFSFKDSQYYYFYKILDTLVDFLKTFIGK